jgi:hypothetical protein
LTPIFLNLITWGATLGCLTTSSLTQQGCYVSIKPSFNFFVLWWEGNERKGTRKEEEEKTKGKCN